MTLVAPAGEADAAAQAEAALWAEARAGSVEAREALFALHAPLAQRIAARHLRASSAGDLELMELRQLAYAGLLEAIDRFDPDRGVPFRAYAGRRIAGSVADGAAKTSEVREQLSYQNRIRAERTRSLAAADEGERSGAAAVEALADLAVGLALGFMLDAAGLAAGPDAADARPSPYEGLAWREALRRLASELDALPAREQTVIRRHYLDGIAFEEIGRLLGVSKGRVSQLHRGGLARLAGRMAPGRGFGPERLGPS